MLAPEHRLRPVLWGTLAAAALAGSLAVGDGAARAAGTRGEIVIPDSGTVRPGDAGKRYHTNVELLVPPGGFAPSAGIRASVPVVDWLVETPASLACAYGLVTVASGCNPYLVTANPKGGSNAIAVVDAYNYPAAKSDLAVFSDVFGLAAANFSVIYGTGSPSAGCKNGPQPQSSAQTGWDVEAALDIEWAHAMAPSAKLYLVEANSPASSDLQNAVSVAAACVQANTKGQVSNSWGSAEFEGENASDSIFTGKNVVYFFAAGDAAGVSYPAASPNVIGVGGTTFSRNQTTGSYQSQAIWNIPYPYSGSTTTGGTANGTGGGPSAYEQRPAYQSGVAAIVGTARGTPDLTALADPDTGVWIYNSTYNPGKGEFMAVGGTSVATPVTAGIFNELGLFYGSSPAALTAVYSASFRKKYLTAVSSGLCGPTGYALNQASGGTTGYPGGFGPSYDPAWLAATTGLSWNWCSGWGSLHGSK
jgi:kumamolisin